MHTRSEERPPVAIHDGAIVQGQHDHRWLRHLFGGARREERALARRLRRARRGGPRVDHPDGHWIEAGARVERAIVDKSVRIGRKARIGKAARGEKSVDGAAITMIGKNAEIPDGATVRRGTVIHTDVTAEQFSAPRRKRKTAAVSS